jgi:hypothetical protein
MWRSFRERWNNYPGLISKRVSENCSTRQGSQDAFHTEVLEMARCESEMVLGREASSDANLPLVTGQYKGSRNPDRSDEDSAGPIVPLEGTGQQNPA